MLLLLPPSLREFFPKLTFFSILATASFASHSWAQAPTSSDVTARPSVHDLVREAATSGQRSIRLPGGQIQLEKTLELSQVKDLEIDGNGSTLIMADPGQAILRLKRCSNITLRNLRFDYSPLPFTQGTVISADKHSVEFELHADYPDLTHEYSGAAAHFFTPDGHRHPSSFDFNKMKLEMLSPRRGRARFAEKLPAVLASGDLIAMDRRFAARTSSAVEIRNCTGPVLFEDISLHSSPALCFVGRYNHDTVTFRRVKISPGPPPEGATHKRLLSSNADGVNFAQCRRGPVLESCDFSGMGDDSFNVHGFFMPIVRVISPTRFITAYKYQKEILEPMRTGDVLRLFNAGDFSQTGETTLSTIVPSEAKVELSQKEVDHLFHSFGRVESLAFYQVDVTSPLDILEGQWFDLPAVNCPGYIIRDSYFHDHRARGLRLMAGDGLVENNRFERLTKTAISIGPELGYWRESGWVDKVHISGNSLRDIGVDRSLAASGSYAPGAIAIFGRTDLPAKSTPPQNRRITIQGNRIENSSVAGIYGYGARDIVIKNNTLIRTNTVRTPGHVDGQTGLSTTGPISVSAISKLVEENNQISPSE